MAKAASSTSAPISAQDHAASFSKRDRTIALVVVAFAFVMDLLDNTIVNVAIPSIQANLGASYATIQWLVAGYSLAFALLLVTGGRMGDVYGYKKIFMVGVVGFTLASLLSGIAWTPGVLIATRLLQGGMAALMVPQVMSLMQVMFKPEERAGVNGLFGALGGMAASLGPIVGGLLIKANVFGWDWRPIFLINVPVGIFAIVAAVKYLPNGKSPHPLHLDITGTVLLVGALGLLVYPLIEGRDLGWPLWTYIMMAASAPLIAIFAWWQRRKMARDGSPLIVPALFRLRSFAAGVVINIVFEAAMLSYFLTSTLILQIGLGFSPIRAAITGLPIAIGIAFTMALLGQKVVPKLGRYSITLGTVVMASGLLLTSWLVNHYGLAVHSWQFIPCLLPIGVGMGLVFAPLMAVVLNDVDTKHAGSASGVLNAVQQVGGAVGVAVIGVIFFGQLGSNAARSFSAVEPALRTQLTAQHLPAAAQTQIVSGVKQCFIDRTHEKDSTVVPASCKQGAAMAQVSPKLGQEIQQAALTANARNFAHAFRWGISFGVALLALTFGLTFVLPKRIRAEAFKEAEAAL
ncbi:MAG TPA: MFS transporter [Candidatus Saccharimonadales bacterium]|nr:MFS transporter [Candidatus Saccharimonadales bacterium]